MSLAVRRAVVCVTALASLATGCAQEADGDLDDPRTAADRRADLATARAMLLTADDLGGGWRAGPAGPADAGGRAGGGNTGDARFEACLDLPADRVARDDPAARSPTFSSVGDEHQIMAGVTFTPSAAVAERELAPLLSGAAGGCVSEAFERSIVDMARERPRPGVELGEAEVERLRVDDLGEGAAGFHNSIAITTSGQDHTLYYDILYVRADRVGITLAVTSADEPFDPAEERRLARLIAARAPD